MGSRILLLLSLLLGFAAAQEFPNPCVWEGQARWQSDDTVQEVYLNPKCNSGELWWVYPSGSLKVNFKLETQRDFRLCLKHDHDKFVLQQVTDLTGGQNMALSIPVKGKDTCLMSSGGQATVQIKAPAEKIYMTFIDYEMTEI